MAELAANDSRRKPLDNTKHICRGKAMPRLAVRHPIGGPKHERARKPEPRKRHNDGSVTLGWVKTRKHYNRGQRIRRKSLDRLLNNKKDTASVAEGAAEITPTGQRHAPAPRMRRNHK